MRLQARGVSHCDRTFTLTNQVKIGDCDIGCEALLRSSGNNKYDKHSVSPAPRRGLNCLRPALPILSPLARRGGGAYLVQLGVREVRANEAKLVKLQKVLLYAKRRPRKAIGSICDSKISGFFSCIKSD